MTLEPDPAPGATSPALPELPDGWHYTDDVAWDEPTPSHRRRMLVLGVTIVALVVAATAALVVLDAAAHYARGVTALKAHSYTAALSEFAGAKLVVFPYRDSRALADQARHGLAAEAAGEQQAAARMHSVTDVIDKAAAALESGTANDVVAALSALPAGDLQDAAADSAAVRTAASTLGKGPDDRGLAGARALRVGRRRPLRRGAAHPRTLGAVC